MMPLHIPRTMVLTMVSKWCELGFVHPQYHLWRLVNCVRFLSGLTWDTRTQGSLRQQFEKQQLTSDMFAVLATRCGWLLALCTEALELEHYKIRMYVRLFVFFCFMPLWLVLAFSLWCYNLNHVLLHFRQGSNSQRTIMLGTKNGACSE